MSDGSKGAAGGLHADVVRRLLARAAVFFRAVPAGANTPHARTAGHAAGKGRACRP